MDRADKAERELSKAQQEISDRTLSTRYEFDKPIPIMKMMKVWQQDLFHLFPDENSEERQMYAEVQSWDIEQIEEYMLYSIFSNDGIFRHKMTNCELNDPVPRILHNYMMLVFLHDEGVAPFLPGQNTPLSFEYVDIPLRSSNTTCWRRDIKGIQSEWHGFPKICYQMIEKILTHTIEELEHEPLEKVLAEIHELQTELGLTEYAFRDSSDED
eukprot:SAG11_NODE_3441_length_2445_cov_18.767263_3_plen_213_part_00